MNAREAAYYALLSSMRGEQFIQSFLEKWKRQHSPSPRDFHFAQELAYGTMRMQLTLEHYAQQLNESLKLKRKEKTLLILALYQATMMDRVPLHALVHESVEMAKKFCHQSFAKFLNALLRKIPETHFTLPEGDDAKSLSIRYSYPEFFVSELLKQTDLTQTIDILEAGNLPGKTMARIRKFSTVTILDNPQQYADSPDLYIQNVTPVTLIGECAKHLSKPPKNILDLCASPGGKALAVHDLFPEAKLTVNDISESKIRRIEENFNKYNVSATMSISPGETFSSDEKFDLIILDVPCSNSGVLNKRHEARWRITPESLKELQQLQQKLIENALSLLSPKGQLWYMTCSILKSENGGQSLLKNHIYHKLIFPNPEGWDGGYACIMEDPCSQLPIQNN